MKKLFSTIFIALALMILFVGCGSKEVDKEEVKVEPVNIHVIAPNGTPTLSMVKLFEENPSMGDGVTVTYESIAATDVLASKLTQQEADIAIVPTNLAANMYNKEVPYKLAGSSVWGILYLVSTEEVNGWEDLKGKEISMIGRGLTPDATFRYLLTKNNVEPDKDVSLKYFSGGSELAASFISGKGEYALIPEPLLTKVLMKRKDAKVVLDMQREWSTATGLESYPQASIIVSDDLINNHPEVVDKFLNAYEEGIKWANDNPLEAGKYYENLGIGLKAPLINKAMAGCNIRYVGATDAKESLEAYLNVLFEFNPKLLGGKLPDEGLYLER
ncbi:ABC transporter substrate-binding protein [Anaeromicrobium sediminis]|uniref:Taurine ABC transporter substrate-binding protein n=1 Tax=Anaeromicrobium sediminis TaxID=1478221 RepID=A0A267MP48_9FIRM|nr:ABC transporter substrate-binding protein [Anaeromicrobium sediminis]PAB60678.1 taurine ABC transporter substrate-binding protein [Anaeromicrobium sediminis]